MKRESRKRIGVKGENGHCREGAKVLELWQWERWTKGGIKREKRVSGYCDPWFFHEWMSWSTLCTWDSTNHTQLILLYTGTKYISTCSYYTQGRLAGTWEREQGANHRDSCHLWSGEGNSTMILELRRKYIRRKEWGHTTVKISR